MRPPYITIITAVFNGAATLQRCIDSVTSQTYPHKELIIMDGGSTDGTIEILKANSDKVAYWKSESDRGIYHAWNKGLDHAKGKWIIFLGADDYLWDSDVLEHAVPYLESAEAEGIRVVYGQGALLGRNDEVIETRGDPWEVAVCELYQGLPMFHGATLHHRNLFRDHGRFDESFRIVGDYDLLLRELRHREAKFMPEVVVVGMSIGGVSSQPANNVLMLWENAKARHNNGKTPFSGYFLKHFPKALIGLVLYKLLGVRITDSLVDIYRVFTGRPRVWTTSNHNKVR